MLEIKNIRKSFGENEVLKGINFKVEKGEVLTIIGSSGSGKTTLLRCLNFLEFPDEGEILLGGDVICDAKTVRTLKEGDLRRARLNFGLVFQSFNLFPQYTVLENITLPMKRLAINEKKETRLLLKKSIKSKEDLKKKLLECDSLCSDKLHSANEKARELLGKVGLSEKEKAYPFQLSGGQCQRVAIARALALEPKILCFDEPTSALDPELTGEVLRVIKQLKGGDNTMIIVTHEMSFAKSVSDKVIFMADGVIEEYGTPEEIFDNPVSEKTRAFLSNSEE